MGRPVAGVGGADWSRVANYRGRPAAERVGVRTWLDRELCRSFLEAAVCAPAGANECLKNPPASVSNAQLQRRASMERMRQQWMRLRAAQSGVRERTGVRDAGVTSGRAAGPLVEEPMVSQDARGP